MKALQSFTKEQLYAYLESQSGHFYSTVSSALDFTLFGDQSLHEEDLSEFLEMLDRETAEKIKVAALQSDDNEQPTIILAEHEDSTSLDLVTEDGEGYKVILFDKSINLSGTLFIEDYIILIVIGNIEAENIIVNGSLYCTGNLSCDVLFGASGNDHETYFGGNISSVLIAENGHYTVAEGSIHSKYLISLHNVIEAKAGRIIENITLDGSNEAEVLCPEILDENGYFEEESFLNFISNHPPDSIFK
ncbi:hypothetical protein BBH99_13475 [Chryseobacterium contaminans]|uniref:Septum formation inhibitor MinC n=1 Tax=Chryseobacterium contaminans TaxID=1423959 RepID=A0A1M7CCU4_9FLAO|nr:hypothetical protein [Chryseobacterium contaminans]OCA71873.1 hypothetical protein BBH99_13475 [Chryseobacterium contaminans]SHL64977.1 Septum formation inhibitor MinC [Chryseobacterium contaminans]